MLKATEAPVVLPETAASWLNHCGKENRIVLSGTGTVTYTALSTKDIKEGAVRVTVSPGVLVVHLSTD